MQVELVDLPNIDSAQRDRWLALFHAATDARFFVHPHWLQCVASELMPAGLRVVFLYQEDTLSLVLPLCEAHGKTRRRHPAHDHLSLNDLLIHPNLAESPTQLHLAIECALNEAGKGWWDWQISNVPHHSVLVQHLIERGNSNSTLNTGTETGLNLDICTTSNDSANNWRMRISRQSASFDCTSEECPPHAKLKRNLRRLRNQLQDGATLSVETVTDKQALENAFDVFLETESSGWKGNNADATAIATDTALTGFYRALLNSNSNDIEPVINLLWRDQTCCAAQFGLRIGTRLSLLKIGYNEDYARYSPGYLLLESVLADAKENGIQTVSLVTSPPWADRWHPDKEPVWQICRYNNNPFGTALRQFDKFKDAAKSRIKSAA